MVFQAERRETLASCCHAFEASKRLKVTLLSSDLHVQALMVSLPPLHHPHPSAEPLPLMDLCRRAARLALGRERIHHIEALPLPQTLKNYLQYQ